MTILLRYPRHKAGLLPVLLLAVMPLLPVASYGTPLVQSPVTTTSYRPTAVQSVRATVAAADLSQGDDVADEQLPSYQVPRSTAWWAAGLLALIVLLTGFLLYKVLQLYGSLRRLQSDVDKYRAIADNTYNWEFWLSPDGHFVYSSPSCERITGYTAEEFYADPGLLSRIVHPDDRQLLEDHRHDSTWKLGTGAMQFRITHRSGGVRRLQHFCQPVFDDTGKFLGSRGSNTDITQ